MDRALDVQFVEPLPAACVEDDRPRLAAPPMMSRPGRGDGVRGASPPGLKPQEPFHVDRVDAPRAVG